MYCAALWDRLEGVTSIVNQSFDWQLLSAEKYFTVLLEEHVFAYCSIVYSLFLMGMKSNFTQIIKEQ